MKTEDILVVIRDLYSGLYRGNKVIVKEVPPVGWNIVKIYKVSDQKKNLQRLQAHYWIYTPNKR